jgi:hypothetical protein
MFGCRNLANRRASLSSAASTAFCSFLSLLPVAVAVVVVVVVVLAAGAVTSGTAVNAITGVSRHVAAAADLDANAVVGTLGVSSTSAAATTGNAGAATACTCRDAVAASVVLAVVLDVGVVDVVERTREACANACLSSALTVLYDAYRHESQKTTQRAVLHITHLQGRELSFVSLARQCKRKLLCFVLLQR